MESITARQPDRILLFESSRDDLMGVANALADAIPGAEITPVFAQDGYHQAVGSNDFDLVILDYDVPGMRSPELLAKLKLRENEPEILLVAKCDDAAVVKSIAESKQRYIMRDAYWVESLICSVRDLLRIRRLEQEMISIRAKLTEANSMLEEKNRRLDEFCSTVAHDVRGPLAGIMLKLEYLMDAYEGEFDERCHKILGRALSGAERLTEIVQAMYEFAKLGTKATNFRNVNLTELVNEVLADLNLDLERDVKIGVGELPVVWGNPGLLRRVFINLVNNAVKYNKNPEVKINIGCSGVEEKSIGAYANLFIEDNGDGIPEDEMKGVFTMFRRGTTAPPSDGLGVGLAVVQRIVELHLGRIDVRSNVGTGTRFEFSLPVAKVELVS